ncbi:Hypothetical protein, putative [Bodo saltans]|uniref:Histone RNA hairpin-binding protein RNA-binding domain-containing protein n=1 Tax=Bodo saltans TaxID=75058 RepID=A0A0S4JF42_BODSA|nr:Hypothetical protein, putative [Bodo saltans]|eukprot:CUG87777.1 Hypothetical protein, putative [Bodo saltans]
MSDSSSSYSLPPPLALNTSSPTTILQSSSSSVFPSSSQFHNAATASSVHHQQQPPLHLHPHQYSHFSPSLMTSSGASPPFQPSPPLAAQQLWLPPQQQQYLPSSSSFSNNSNTHNHNNHSPPHLSIPSPAMPLPGGGGVQYMPNHYISIGSPLGAGVGSSANSSPPPTPTPSMAPPLYGATSSNSLVGQTTFGQLTVNPHGASPRLLPATPINNTSMRSLGSVPSPTAATAAAHTTTTPTSSMFHQSLGYSGGVTHGHFTPHHMLIGGRSPLARSTTTGGLTNSSVTVSSMPPSVMPSPSTPPMSLPASASSTPHVFFGMGGPLTGSIHLQQHGGPQGGSSAGRYNGLSDSSASRHFSHHHNTNTNNFSLSGGGSIPYGSAYSSTNNDSDVNSGSRGNGGPPRKGPDSPNLGPAAPPIGNSASLSGGAITTYASIGSFSQLSATPQGTSFSAHGGGGGTSGYSSGNSNRSRCSSRGPTTRLLSPGNVATVILGGNSQQQQDLATVVTGTTQEVLQVLSSPNSAPLVVCGDVQSDSIVAPPVTASKTQLRKRGDLKLKRERAAVTAQQQFQQGQQLPSAASTTAPSYAIHFPGLENPSGNNGHHNFVTRGEELLASPPPAAVIALPQYQQHYIHHPHHSVVVGGRGADGAGGVESNSDATLYSSNPFVNISMTTTTASESSAGATILSSPAAALPVSIHHNNTLGAAPQHSIPKVSSSFDVGHAPTPALTIPSRGRGAEDSTVSLATAAASNRRAPLEALTDHRIKQRSKQIRYGKVTDGYRNYRMFVPIPLRQVGNPDHPETPRDEAHISKRHWDVRMREWRRALHAWDKIHSDTAAQQLERAGLFTADTLLEQDTPGFNLEEYLAATKLELENLQQEVAWHMAERERRRDAGLASEESGDDGEETTTASESTAKRKQRRRHNTADSDPLSSPPVAPQPPPTSAESTLTTAAAPAIQQEEEEQVVEYGQDLIHEYRTTTPHGLKSSTAGESGVPIAPSPVSRRVGKVAPNKSPDRPIVGHMDPHAIAKMPEIIAVLSPQSNGALAIPGSGSGGASRHGIHPIQSPLKTHSGHSYRSLRSSHPDTPPRAGGALGAMQLGASLSSAHGNGSLSNSPVIGAMSIFQPYVEYDYFSLTQQPQHHQCRTVVTILHIDSNAQGSASSRNNSNNPPPGPTTSVGATATNATGGASSTKVNHRGSVGSNMSPLMQSGEGGGRAGSTGRQISPPTASLLSPTASPAITRPNTLQYASPFSGLLPAMSIPSLASPSSQSSGGGGTAGSFEKLALAMWNHICHHPGDVLKALRQGLGLNPSRLTYAKQHHHTQGWDSPLLSPQSLYNVEERQLDTIEAVADWLKQAHPTSSPSGSQSTFTSSEDDMQMLRQVSDDRVSGGSNEVLPTTGGNGAAFQRSPTTVAVPPRQYPLRHLYILNRGTVRPQSCDEFAANASLSTPLQTHQGVPTTPQTPGKTTPSTGRASASTCGSPPIVNPLVGVTRPTPLTTAVTTSTSNNTAAPLSSTSTFQQLGIVHRVREGSMVNNPNGSMTANTSLFIAEQRSFFAQTTTAEEDLPLRPTTRQPGSSERTSPSSTGGGAAVVPTSNGFGDDILFKDGQVAQDLLQVVVGAPSSSPPRVPSSNASASSSQQSHSLHVAKAAPHPRHIVFDTGNYRSLSADQSPIQRNNAAKMDDIDPLESSVGRHFRQQHNSSVPNESRNSEGMNLDPTPTELVHQAGSPSPNLSSASATGQPLLSPAERAASFRPRGDEDHASLTNTAVFVDSQLKD